MSENQVTAGTPSLTDALSPGGVAGLCILHVILFVFLACLIVQLWPAEESANGVSGAVVSTAAPTGTGPATTAGAAGKATPGSTGSSTGSSAGGQSASVSPAGTTSGSAQSAATRPTAARPTAGDSGFHRVYLLWHIPLDMTEPMRMLVLVMLLGAFGSLIQSASFFTVRVANRTMGASWLWWYFVHPFVGMAVATILYLMVRAGFLNPNPTTGSISIYGTAALAGLSGWFSKQAAAKMQEVFESLFRTEPSNSPPPPRISQVDPAALAAVAAEGGAPQSLTLKGSGFVPNSVVRLNGTDCPTSFVSAAQLTASVPAAKASQPGSLKVTVFNPPPGGGESPSIDVEVK